MNKPAGITDPSLAEQKEFNTRLFWKGAFLIYMVIEAMNWIFNYLNLYHNCYLCLRPVHYYILQWLINVLFTGLVWYLLDKAYKSRLFLISVANLLLFIFHHMGLIGLTYFIQNAGGSWMESGYRYNAPLTELVFESWFDIGKYILKITAFYLLKFYTGYRLSEQQRIKLAVINKGLQLNLLKQQLSPHFYFNTLNNLYGMARTGSLKLTAALDQLSNIMRYVIVECNQPKVLLKNEISFLQSYLSLEKLRYEENVLIDMQVNGQTGGHMIMPLLLIQLVENAFKHGLKEKSEQNWMRARMEIFRNEIIFLVENHFNGQPMGEGIGLDSLKQRLNLQYGGKYELLIAEKADRFSVTLKLNLS